MGNEKDKEDREVMVDWGFILFVFLLMVVVFTLILCLVWREKLLEWIRQFWRDLSAGRWRCGGERAEVADEAVELNGPPPPPSPPTMSPRRSSLVRQQKMWLSLLVKETEEENGEEGLRPETDPNLERGRRMEPLGGDSENYPINEEVFKETRV